MKKTIINSKLMLIENCKPLTAEDAKNIKGGCGCDMRRPHVW